QPVDDAGDLSRLIRSAPRCAGQPGLRFRPAHQPGHAQRPADTADPPMGGGDLCRGSLPPGAAVVLHRRVPPAPAAALADLGGTSPTRHGGRLDRLDPAGRHAVRRQPVTAAGGAPVDPGGGHAPDAVGVRRRCPRPPDHPAILLAALPGAAARHDRPAPPRAPPGPPDRAHPPAPLAPPARLAQPARLWLAWLRLAWPGPAWAWLAWPGPESRGGHLTGAVLCHLRGAHHAG